MNFFTEQDQARRQTRWLLISFLVAVVFLIAITNLLVAISLWLVEGRLENYQQAGDLLTAGQNSQLWQFFSWQSFGKISLFVTGSIACVVLFKHFQLAAGGKKIAESLGGVRVLTNTDNYQQQQLLNVVEEMALASGMPVPSVYLLAGEKGINAFAAGNTPADAVIGVTKGALEHFDREQLQGVIAHEFSHILNGDMRLNLRMIAVLSGITFIANVGELLMRSGGRHGRYHGTRRGNDGRVFLLGLALLIVGWLGTFFGGFIKAAISRQREFLADASAVQFTRNPKGIADALKIIGGYSAGSQVFSSGAGEASHMFIAKALGSWASFDTHPPLQERIYTIEPNWNGQFIRRALRVEPSTSQSSALHGEQDRKRQAAMAAMAAQTFIASRAQTGANDDSILHDARQQHQGIPVFLQQQLKEPFGACAVVLALLLDSNEPIKERQYEFIEQVEIKGLMLQTRQLSDDVQALPASQRWPLLELAMPALKQLSLAQYKSFKRALLLVIRADKKFELFEWCLFQTLRHYLAADFEKNKIARARFKKVSEVAEEYNIVLSSLVWFGHDDDQQDDIQRAFSRGANTAGLYNIQLMLREQCQLDDFIKAVEKLANCYPLIKPKLLKGLCDCARHDGVIADQEREMIAAIAAVMDCPQPLLAIH